MNCKKRYIPYLVGEALCLIAELALFVFALLSGSVVAIALAAVASAMCAGAVAFVILKLLNIAPRRASTVSTKGKKSSDRSLKASSVASGAKKLKSVRLELKSFNGLRRKSLLLSLVIAAMISLSVGMLTVGALILHTKFEVIFLPVFASVLIGLGAFLIVGLAVFSSLYRSDKALARILDERFGLQERVQTMMAYRAREEAIFALQREDAESVINSIPKRAIKIRRLWVYVVCLVLSAGVLASSLLYTKAAPPEPPVEQTPFELTAIQIAAMEELIDYVSGSEMESPYRENVAFAVTALLDELKLATTVTERDASLGKALKAIYNETDLSSSAVEIIEALWTSGAETLKPLAEALNYYVWQKGSEWDEYVAALSKVRAGYIHPDSSTASADVDKMTADIAALLTSDSSAIIVALTRSGIPSEDAIYLALKGLASANEGFKGFSTLAPLAAQLGYTALEGEIDSAFSAVTPMLYSAIEANAASTETGEYAMTRICDLFGYTLPNFKRPVLRDSSVESGGGDDTEGGGMGGIGSGTVYGSDDLVLDPYTDKYVEYGTILDKYYSLMFGKTEDGDYTEEEIAALKKYFEILYGGFEDRE